MYVCVIVFERKGGRREREIERERERERGGGGGESTEVLSGRCVHTLFHEPPNFVTKHVII